MLSKFIIPIAKHVQRRPDETLLCALDQVERLSPSKSRSFFANVILHRIPENSKLFCQFKQHHICADHVFHRIQRVQRMLLTLTNMHFSLSFLLWRCTMLVWQSEMLFRLASPDLVSAFFSCPFSLSREKQASQ